MPSKSDDALVRKVQQQLLRRGIRVPCRVKVSVNKGAVTLSGEVQYMMQRKTALNAAQQVPGVLSAVEKLQVKPAAAAWKRTW